MRPFSGLAPSKLKLLKNIFEGIQGVSREIVFTIFSLQRPRSPMHYVSENSSMHERLKQILCKRVGFSKYVFRSICSLRDFSLIVFVQVLCTYPPGISSYSATESGTTERVLRTRGFLCLELGTSNSMVPFNNSFLRVSSILFTMSTTFPICSVKSLKQNHSSVLKILK